MSKRNQKHARRAQDAYDTSPSAVIPLLPFLPKRARYWEPCAGSGNLVRSIPGCVAASDIVPRFWLAMRLSATEITTRQFRQTGATHFVTNPPWSRPILHLIIDALRRIAPTWLLFDADWMHTKQAVPFLDYCQAIVSVGRVSWMENGTSGFDNCAWYLFGDIPADPVFFGRSGK